MRLRLWSGNSSAFLSDSHLPAPCSDMARSEDAMVNLSWILDKVTVFSAVMVRAVAVATGVVSDTDVIALVAFFDVAAEHRLTTSEEP